MLRIQQKFTDAELHSPLARQVLRQTAETIKIGLSQSNEIEYTISIEDQSWSHQGSFTTAELQPLLAPVIQRTLQRCQQALDQADWKVEDLNRCSGRCSTAVLKYGKYNSFYEPTSGN